MNLNQISQQINAQNLLKNSWVYLGHSEGRAGRTLFKLFVELASAIGADSAECLAASVMIEQRMIEFGQQHPGRKQTAPNRHRIGGPHLDPAYEDTAASAQPILDRAEQHGGTLASGRLAAAQPDKVSTTLRTRIRREDAGPGVG
jgi:hypothetical protein